VTQERELRLAIPVTGMGWFNYLFMLVSWVRNMCLNASAKGANKDGRMFLSPKQLKIVKAKLVSAIPL
jgi:hypothetical protein